MNMWQSFNGTVQVQIISADPPAAINTLNQSGVILYETEYVDDFTLLIQIRRQDYKNVKRIAAKRGEELSLKRKTGLYWTVKGLLKRPVLVIGMLFLLFAGTFLPTRIYFFQVEGNETIPDKMILEYAAQCGISFGASRREVRSEKMKNALLEAIPQLQWAGVNTSGCVATISVREREITEQTPQGTGVSSIVASRDGVILSCTVTRGNGLCKVGQAVKVGQVLISGYTDCGLSIKAEESQGEIYARTDWDLTAVTPDTCQSKAYVTGQKKKYALIIGKNRINFYKDSGISDATCDRMYEEKHLTLPGGFVLPVTLVTEVWTYYACTEETLLPEDASMQLSEFAKSYLNSQMIAGQILSGQENVTGSDGAISLQGQYACHEMIGRVQKEEIMRPYGKSDGTDR